MGSAFSSIFGGGYETPEMPKAASVPKREEITEDETTRNAEARKLRARSGGVRSTLLAPAASTASANNLLGLNQKNF